jgi:hypothetical protein
MQWLFCHELPSKSMVFTLNTKYTFDVECLQPFENQAVIFQSFSLEKPINLSVFVAISGRNMAVLTTQYKYIDGNTRRDHGTSKNIKRCRITASIRLR